jgi:hypothetical protein
VAQEMSSDNHHFLVQAADGKWLASRNHSTSEVKSLRVVKRLRHGLTTNTASMARLRLSGRTGLGMGERGPQARWNIEEAFYWWYNEGRRRTFSEVARLYEVDPDTVSKRADRDDWRRRADTLDQQLRDETERKIAVTAAKARQAAVEGSAALLQRFIQRLPEKLPSGNPNPHYLQPAEMTVRDWEVVVKLMELLSGRATDRVLADESPVSIEEIEEQVRELERREMEKERGSS